MFYRDQLVHYVVAIPPFHEAISWGCCFQGNMVRCAVEFHIHVQNFLDDYRHGIFVHEELWAAICPWICWLDATFDDSEGIATILENYPVCAATKDFAAAITSGRRAHNELKLWSAHILYSANLISWLRRAVD